MFGLLKSNHKHEEKALPPKKNSLKEDLVCIRRIIKQLPNETEVNTLLQDEDNKASLLTVVTTSVAIQNIKKTGECNTVRYVGGLVKHKDFDKVEECLVYLDVELTINLKVLEKKCPEIKEVTSVYDKKFQENLVNCKISESDVKD